MKKIKQILRSDDMKSEILYNGMIFIRRFCRLCLQFCVIGLVVGFFLWGYFTTVKDYYWNANEIVDNIMIHTGNCFLNISDSEDYLQVFLIIQLNSKCMEKEDQNNRFTLQKNFQLKGKLLIKEQQIQDQKMFVVIKYCMVDLMLPKNMTNISILCSIDSECIIVFAQQELYVQNTFNVTCEKSARMQMNIRNIQTNKFSFISDSPRTLFLNHILTKEGYIAMAYGELVIQSTKSFQLVYTSQSQAVCAREFQLTDQIQEDCFISASQNATVIDKICKGQISICEKSSCDVQQQIQVIGNKLLYMPIYCKILESHQQQKVMKFKYFLHKSLIKIQSFMNTSGSADVAVTIDVVGSCLLQYSYTTYWSFFSNPSYARFQPWWLSTFSAGYLNPTFQQLTVSIKPGICPQNPILNSKQKMEIRNFIKQSFNTTYGEAIYIDVDNSLRIDEKLKENENYFGLSHLQQKQKGKFENWMILDDVANNIVYKQLEYYDNFIAAIILSLISSLIFSVVCIYFLKEILKKLETNVLNSCSEFQHYSAATTRSAPKNTTDIVKDIKAKLNNNLIKENHLWLCLFLLMFFICFLKINLSHLLDFLSIHYLD
ncbi:unnamed protein product [Paramecium sonneborni]|uniref:Transmembrane protein n=1 Tax=Paramecium sonneborni TaxID=65129 RepID=A0A8S1RKH3_9CILI|nr:unnamed protein product [Paramecium sonneborni]